MKLVKLPLTSVLLIAALLASLPVAMESQAESDHLDVALNFVASGWIGDGEKGTKYVSLSEGWKRSCHSEPLCIKVSYKPGPVGWAGIHWQNHPDNWGGKPGNNFKKSGYQRLTFWARGENGNEIVEFKAGGIDSLGKKYRDSFEKTAGKVVLTKEWTQYAIDLSGADLSSVIGGFAWVATKTANSSGLTFYLDDIRYER